MPRRVILALIAIVLSFGAASVYVHAHNQTRRIDQLERQVKDLESQVGSYRTAIEALTHALAADEQQLRDLNQKPVATVADVREALAEIARTANPPPSTTTTTRRRTTTTSGTTTTTRPTTTTTRRHTTTTRCRVIPPVCP